MRNGNTREESTNWISINDGPRRVVAKIFQNPKHLKPTIQLGCSTPTDPLDSLDKAFNGALIAYGPSKGLEAIVDSCNLIAFQKPARQKLTNRMPSKLAALAPFLTGG